MDDFPVKNRKRARRRADMKRMKRKAIRIARSKGFNEEDAAKWATNADHLQSCDCWMCVNPRRTFKEKTLQEYKAEDDFKQQSTDPDSIIEDEVDSLINYKLDRYYHGPQITN
jgi:hypothetical protein